LPHGFELAAKVPLLWIFDPPRDRVEVARVTVEHQGVDADFLQVPDRSLQRHLRVIRHVNVTEDADDPGGVEHVRLPRLGLTRRHGKRLASLARCPLRCSRELAAAIRAVHAELRADAAASLLERDGTVGLLDQPASQ